MKPFDILIVGAGIVGSAVARECALIGWRGGVIEGGTPAGGPTAAGMGHVVVMDDSPAQLALTAFSRSLWQRESGKLPKSAEYENRGTIWVAADDEEMAEVHARQEVYEDAGVEARVLTAEELADKEPNLRRGFPGGGRELLSGGGQASGSGGLPGKGDLSLTGTSVAERRREPRCRAHCAGRGNRDRKSVV